MNKPFLGIPLTALLIALNGFSQTQQAVKVFRIGYLITGNLSVNASRRKVFRQALRELGYVEGKNLIIEVRSSEGSPARARALAAELVHLKADVIVTAGSTATRFAKEATTTIPIVMTMDSDPVGNGFVATLARPGGNITGLSNLAPELSGKRLELLKEVVPSLSRVAVFGNAVVPGNARMLKEAELAARAFGVKLQYLDVLISNDIETAFRAARKSRADAVLLLVRGPVALPHRKEIAELAVKSRLPVIYSGREYVEAGGLMSYGVSLDDLDRRAATFVDKILKGAKPAELPIEQPTKFELAINLKTAKSLGLKIPAYLLMEADRVIE